MPPAEPRARRLGRISPQAQQYIATASDEQVGAVLWFLDCLVGGELDCWERVPQGEMPTRGQFGRMVAALASGDVIVWRDYPDSDLFAVFYIGPASAFF